MTDLPDIPQGLAEFLNGHTDSLKEAAGDDLVASFVHGSVATGSFVPYRSDLDVMAVVTQPMDLPPKSLLIRRLWALPTPEMIRGVETKVVTRDEIGDRQKMKRTDLLVSTHPGEPVTVDDFDDTTLFIELEVATDNFLSIHGPPASELIGRIERESVLRWMLEWRATGLAGDGREEPESFEVLNAARSLVYLHEGRHVGKIGAAEWAIENGHPETLLRRAIAVQRGESRDRSLSPDGRNFVQTVIDQLEDAVSGASS